METTTLALQTLLHIDQYLFAFVSNYGAWTYLILFLIIFCETGLVITPFLPGDSLLFAAGTIAANVTRSLNIFYLFIFLTLASILGNKLNYLIGRLVGNKLSASAFILNANHLAHTRQFYEKHGGKTIIFARFMPIIRTFAPFVAGVGQMHYPRFLAFNMVGGAAWVVSFVLLGYHFGNLPVVKDNFTYVIFAIIFISILPALIGFIRHRFFQKA